MGPACILSYWGPGVRKRRGGQRPAACGWTPSLLSYRPCLGPWNPVVRVGSAGPISACCSGTSASYPHLGVSWSTEKKVRARCSLMKHTCFISAYLSFCLASQPRLFFVVGRGPPRQRCDQCCSEGRRLAHEPTTVRLPNTASGSATHVTA